MLAPVDGSRLWSRFLLKLKAQNPFFSTLAMFATFKVEQDVELSLTQEQNLIVSPAFLAEMSEPQQFSYLLHQVLHLALQHIKRGEGRQLKLWNIAADIAVNQIIADTTEWPVAPRTAWDGRFDGQSVERIYAALQKQVQNGCGSPNTATAGSGAGQNSAGDNASGSLAAEGNQEGQGQHSDGQQEQDQHSDGQHSDGHQSGQALEPIDELQAKYQCHQDFRSVAAEQQQKSDAYWRSAMTKATQLHPAKTFGKLSDSLLREVELGHDSQLDWRLMLWKFATPSLADYQEFDHRFIHAGYYTETLQSEKLIVDVIIDTSGSIMARALAVFISEMLAVHQCHPHTTLRFFYADTELYGPYEMPKEVSQIQEPRGCGGTSFIPYFNAQQNEKDFMKQPQASIYFTDGYGDFPKQTPRVPVLWILTEDGCEDKAVPFGTIARIKVS